MLRRGKKPQPQKIQQKGQRDHLCFLFQLCLKRNGCLHAVLSDSPGTAGSSPDSFPAVSVLPEALPWVKPCTKSHRKPETQQNQPPPLPSILGKVSAAPSQHVPV